MFFNLLLVMTMENQNWNDCLYKNQFYYPDDDDDDDDDIFFLLKGF